MHYLDHAAATPMRPRALERLMQASQQDFANPSSSHRLGKRLEEQLRETEGLIKQALRLPQDQQLFFTSCATESNNLMLQSVVSKDDVAFVDMSDHPSLIAPLRARAVDVRAIPLNQGQIDYAAWERSWDGRSKLVTLSLLHGLTGRELNVPELAAWLRARGAKVHLHLDCSQGLGRMPLLAFNNVDSITLSAHKMGGPKGIAALLCGPHVKLTPLFYGGAHQMSVRPGTLPYPLIASWSVLFEELLSPRPSWREKAIALAQELERELSALGMERIGHMGRENGPWIHLYHLAAFGPYPSDMLMRLLEQQHIYISSATACNSKKKGAVAEYSVLGIPESEHGRMIRVSFGHDSTLNDVAALVAGLKQARAQLAHTLGHGARS